MRNARGFTLVEMLVSMSIFAVVTAFATANFRAGRQSDELRIATNVLATTFRRAQTMTVAGQTTPVCRGGGDEGKVCGTGASSCAGGVCVNEVPRGYGVRVSTDEGANGGAILFADFDGDKAYDVGEQIKRESLSSGPFMVMSSVTPVAGGVLDVVFVPPRPKIWFNADDSVAVAQMKVRHTVTGKERSVTVHAVSGQISAE